jgi:hypothetical protein
VSFDAGGNLLSLARYAHRRSGNVTKHCATAFTTAITA